MEGHSAAAAGATIVLVGFQNFQKILLHWGRSYEIIS
tara:strand:- start:1304 stop:1414 length:111 start_codon:yes stop_codon:yes gene_type:complete